MISQFFCNLNPSKNFTCPSAQLRTKFTSPIAKSTSPGLSDTTFFACWPTTPMAGELLNPAMSHLSTSHAALTEQKEREGDKNETMNWPTLQHAENNMIIMLHPATMRSAQIKGQYSSTAESNKHTTCFVLNYIEQKPRQVVVEDTIFCS